MKRETTRVFKILGWMLVVLIVMPMIVLTVMNFKSNSEHECQKGPLAAISKCRFYQSVSSVVSYDPWYSDANGKLDEASCNIVKEGENKLPFSEMQGGYLTAAFVYKISCETLGQGIHGTCYASQKMSSNGNARYVKILIAETCESSRYFEGSKYTIQDGDVIEMKSDWGTPLKDIPDENTGNVEPTQIFGGNMPKFGLSRRG